MAQLCPGVRWRQVVQVAIALHKQRGQAQQQPSNSAEQTQLLAGAKDVIISKAAPPCLRIRPLLPALKGMLAELRCSPVIALAWYNHLLAKCPNYYSFVILARAPSSSSGQGPCCSDRL